MAKRVRLPSKFLRSSSVPLSYFANTKGIHRVLWPGKQVLGSPMDRKAGSGGAGVKPSSFPRQPTAPGSRLPGSWVSTRCGAGLGHSPWHSSCCSPSEAPGPGGRRTLPTSHSPVGGKEERPTDKLDGSDPGRQRPRRSAEGFLSRLPGIMSLSRGHSQKGSPN